jgi:hypothetical protein
MFIHRLKVSVKASVAGGIACRSPIHKPNTSNRAVYGTLNHPRRKNLVEIPMKKHVITKRSAVVGDTTPSPPADIVISA